MQDHQGHPALPPEKLRFPAASLINAPAKTPVTHYCRPLDSGVLRVVSVLVVSDRTAL